MTKDKVRSIEEALKLAMEALKGGLWDYGPEQDEHDRCDEIIAICEEALMSGTDGAQPAVTESHKQEPVATDWERIARVQDAKLRAMCNEAGGFEKLCEVMDKYERTTTPPVAEPHKRPSRSDINPLTAMEVYDVVHDADLDWHTGFALGEDENRFVVFARAIEAAHGIKE